MPSQDQLQKYILNMAISDVLIILKMFLYKAQMEFIYKKISIWKIFLSNFSESNKNKMIFTIH